MEEPLPGCLVEAPDGMVLLANRVVAEAIQACARDTNSGPGSKRVSRAVRRAAETRVWCRFLGAAGPLELSDEAVYRIVLFYIVVMIKPVWLRMKSERLLQGGVLCLDGAETIYGVSDRFAPVSGTVQAYKAVQP